MHTPASPSQTSQSREAERIRRQAGSQRSTAGMVLSWRYSVDNHSSHRNQNDLVRLHWLCTKANIVYNSLLCYFCSTSPLTWLHFPRLLYRSCHLADWKGLRQLTSSLGTQSVTTIQKADRVTDFFGYIIGMIGRVWLFFLPTKHNTYTTHHLFPFISFPRLKPNFPQLFFF